MTDRHQYTEKESAICDKFTELATKEGWTVYPECEGWDMLLVWEKDDSGIPIDSQSPLVTVKRGEQIGIQAKARPNFVVIKQCIEYKRKKNRPHRTAVLVPKTVDGFLETCHAAGISVFTPNMKPIVLASEIKQGAYEKRPEGLEIWTPHIVPDLPAGVAGPQQLTKWKQGALILCYHLRNRGYITSNDFREHNIDITLWRRNNWIKREGDAVHMKGGYGQKVARYVLGTNIDTDFPDIGWESIRDELAKELDL